MAPKSSLMMPFMLIGLIGVVCAFVYDIQFPGHATLSDASFPGGANGNGNYGTDTALLDEISYKNGLMHNACFRIECVDKPWCKSVPTDVTIAGPFRPNSILSCNSQSCNPLLQLLLRKGTLLRIANDKVTDTPVMASRVFCAKVGGIKFTITGHDNLTRVLPENMAGAGNIKKLFIKGSGGQQWQRMQWDGDGYWRINCSFVGQSLSFLIIAGDDARLSCNTVFDAQWTTGQTIDSTGCQFKPSETHN
ncbi:expansin-A8-like [Abrus precatorius]|uniref:Expansin n=1 Tax=Abrus precatorius TaxID=3816 RepID=A0A8B8JPT9_ABRPR|nr:expansin-A8-like [Abrus precatorius]XP_027333526.1 expansin-A8-like [Abrus precatorius]XP_027333527.1 expansin-A8-like [Abrus precatorius]